MGPARGGGRSGELARALARTLDTPPSEEKREEASRSVGRRYAVERLVDDMRRIYTEELEGTDAG